MNIIDLQTSCLCLGNNDTVKYLLYSLKRRQSLTTILFKNLSSAIHLVISSHQVEKHLGKCKELFRSYEKPLINPRSRMLGVVVKDKIIECRKPVRKLWSTGRNHLMQPCRFGIYLFVFFHIQQLLFRTEVWEFLYFLLKSHLMSYFSLSMISKHW